MLVEVEDIAGLPSGSLLARIRTAFGHAAFRWCGAPDVPPGPYHVEWTIDEETVWGQNAGPAGQASSAFHQEDHGVTVQGRLELTVDGAAVLDMGGHLILLDVAGRIPATTHGSWVNLYLRPESIALYPVRALTVGTQAAGLASLSRAFRR